jgi:hypothetical protein
MMHCFALTKVELRTFYLSYTTTPHYTTPHWLP